MRRLDGLLVDLFQKLLFLEAAERKEYLLRVAREHPDHAEALEALLAKDGEDGPIPAEPKGVSVELAGFETRADRLDDLAGISSPEGRYVRKEAIGRGGMGTVFRVRDQGLQRDLAMKQINTCNSEENDSRVSRHLLARFLNEARIMGCLDHPGIVPVHELGVDSHGRVYFTMALIKGLELQRVLALARRGEEGWNQTRVLGVIVRACETMAFAHEQGVIHRDLKPSNVMVGRFGEVYVVDWGVACRRGTEDRCDLRPAQTENQAVGRMSDSLVKTMDGTVIGTPHFIPPEQAAGHIDRIDERSDVYAIGAMLYQLLTGQRPFEDLVHGRSPYEAIQEMARPNRQPIPVRVLAPEVPAELAAICEKAMAPDQRMRYADTSTLASDLRAFAEQRVVGAYHTGLVAELRKWVARNKAVSALILSTLATAVVGFAWTQAVRERARREQLLDLDLPLLRSLLVREEGLFPPTPGNAPAMRAWLDEAQSVLLREPHHRERAERASGTAEQQQAGQYFAVANEFKGEDGLIARVRERVSFADSVHDNSIGSADAIRAWGEAIAAIADVDLCPVYNGLTIPPQLGLVPIGQDPQSGLWEFCHVLSGAVPARDLDTGAIVFTERTGIILVLVPGGQFVAEQDEQPRKSGDDWYRSGDSYYSLFAGREVQAFFLSKYEVSQGQWKRLTRNNPSRCQEGWAGYDFDLTHPVEMVSWVQSKTAMENAALRLPTSIEWEYAARAGQLTVWLGGDRQADLSSEQVNIADDAASRKNSPFAKRAVVGHDDGYVAIARVHALKPNPFGFHHIIGNLWEWCDSAHPADPVRMRTVRGACFASTPDAARFAHLEAEQPDAVHHENGLRPARSIDL